VAFLRRLIDASGHAHAKSIVALDAITQFSNESGIPPVLLRDDIALVPESVRTFLRDRVMGQDAAIDRVTEVVSVIKAGLSDLRKPIAVLFFAGPTGVGKTELSKALAEFVFGSRERLVRLDMGEYAGPDALSRLVGEPHAPGHLTAAVRRQPFSVVLLDEIEKAHPAVFDALLGVLGEGRLTDADDRFTDFRNAVIVMTSNLGVDTMRARVGFGTSADAATEARETRRHYVSEAERFFRPELFNRIDDFVVFAPLGPEPIRAIVAREVERVARREGFTRHEVTLHVAPAALDHLAQRGFDPRYGARPLKRAIERQLVVPIGEYMAEHPRISATRLDADAIDGRLALRATSVGRDDDARAAALAAFKAASLLRGEVRRWSRCALANALRQRVAYFDRVSRAPAFWTERAEAEKESQRASVAREVIEALDEASRQAEAAEDLSFEAYHRRAGSEARALYAEVEATARAFAPLRERLYATMYPRTTGVVMYLTSSRASWRWIPWMCGSYRRWAQARGLTSNEYVARLVPPAEREPRGSTDPHVQWKWQADSARAHETPEALAVAVAIDGGPAATLLAAEHGAHRFHDGSTTQMVRVRFDPVRARGVSALAVPHELAKSMPETEIRRVAVFKGTARDMRTGRDHPVAATYVELASLLDDWMQWRVFRSEAEPWS
jgi:MoxR-like ATPase